MNQSTDQKAIIQMQSVISSQQNGDTKEEQVGTGISQTLFYLIASTRRVCLRGPKILSFVQQKWLWSACTADTSVLFFDYATIFPVPTWDWMKPTAPKYT